MKFNPIHTQMYIKYIPIWVDVDGKTVRGFPYESVQECEEFFTHRVTVGLQDKSYKIEQVDVTQFVATTQPNKPITRIATSRIYWSWMRQTSKIY